MCGSGAATGMMGIIMGPAIGTTLWGRQTVRTVCCAAARGASTPGTAVLPTVSATARAAASTTWASA